MDKSMQEEILCSLWTISSVLCFGFGFNGFGYAFAIKAVLDGMCCVYNVAIEIKKEKNDI